MLGAYTARIRPFWKSLKNANQSTGTAARMTAPAAAKYLAARPDANIMPMNIETNTSAEPRSPVRMTSNAGTPP